MNDEQVHQEIYRGGLGNLLRDRVRESMRQQKRTCRDLATQLSGEIGLKETSTSHIIAHMRFFPGNVLPFSDSHYVSVSPKERLRRVSLVLNALNFDANEEVILRLRRLYGNDFAYPPRKKIDLEGEKNSWLDYL